MSICHFYCLLSVKFLRKQPAFILLAYSMDVMLEVLWLKEGWTGDKEAAIPVNTYVVEMRQWLADMAQLVAKHSSRSQERQKQYYDTRAKACSFKVGDQVLLLFPTTVNRLKLQWTGPFKVTRKLGTVDYEVETPGRRQERKIYHINLMKNWYVMPSRCISGCKLSCQKWKTLKCWQDSSEEQFFPLELDGVQEVNLNVSEPKRGQLCEILLSFPQVLTTQPGRTNHYLGYVIEEEL